MKQVVKTELESSLNVSTDTASEEGALKVDSE